MEEKLAAAESLGSASGIHFQGFLDALQSRRARWLYNKTASKHSSQTDLTTSSSNNETHWLISPKKSLKSQWSELQKKVYGLFENNREGMELVAERQNQYQKIAEFSLSDSDHENKSESENVPNITLNLPDSGDSLHKRRSPVTVQEWIDHLPQKTKNGEKERTREPEEPSRNLAAAASRLSREASVQSSSSLDSLLDSRKPDPVEILLNLGFGVDLDHCRIPKRFLVPSKCRGGNWDEFLRRELLMVQNFECSSLGFRGLSGPSYQRPSAIVANIMEKLRECESHLMASPRTPEQPTEPKTVSSSGRFNAVAKRVACEAAVLNKMQTQSVLTPDNRKFLESQGKISPEVPRRRIIFGQKSFAINNEGECVELDSPVAEKLTHKDSNLSLCSSVSNESDSEPRISSLERLKLRRSSLQRQQKIESDEEQLAEEDANNNGSGTKIPQRFLSTNSLKLVPEDSLDEDAGCSDVIRQQLLDEIQSLSQKIQFANSQDLTAILEQMKELRTKLEGQ